MRIRPLATRLPAPRQLLQRPVPPSRVATAAATGEGSDAVVAVVKEQLAALPVRVDTVEVHESAARKQELLLAAAEEGCQSEVERLLSDPATNPNMQDKYGQTALLVASFKGHTKVVAALLRAGAHVDAKFGDNETALYWASHWGHTEVVEALLRAGAATEVVDKDGMTALHFASKNGRTEVVAALLRTGADTNARNSDGKTLLDVTGDPEAEALLWAWRSK